MKHLTTYKIFESSRVPKDIVEFLNQKVSDFTDEFDIPCYLNISEVRLPTGPVCAEVSIFIANDVDSDFEHVPFEFTSEISQYLQSIIEYLLEEGFELVSIPTYYYNKNKTSKPPFFYSRISEINLHIKVNKVKIVLLGTAYAK